MKPIWITESGRIATVQEGNTINATFDVQSDSVIALDFLSGELPPGTYINKVSNTRYQILGVVSAIPREKEFYFAIRAENTDGWADIGLSILVTQIIPQWTTPSRLATIAELEPVEHQFQLSDPGGTAEFKKIAGTLPPGVSINQRGLLKGRVEEVETDTLYQFTMQAVSSEGTTLQKDFEILVLESSGNRAPIWLSSAGEIGEINNGEDSSLLISAFDPDGTAITYSLVSGFLPDGLTLNPVTGEIEGVCSTSLQQNWPFSIQITDGVNTKIRNFSIKTNENFDASVNWVTPAGSLGSLKIGENSLIVLEAASNYPIRFSIASGALPEGLSLHPSEATIFDDTGFQTTGTKTFVVTADNGFVQANREFQITIEPGYSANALRAYLQLPYQEINEYREVIEFSDFERTKLFRPYDKRYGVQEFPRMLVFENMNSAQAFELKARYENQLTPIEFLVGDLKFAYARDENGFVIYEVIYRELIEINHLPLIEFDVPQTGQTVQPASVANFRERFSSEFPGVSGGTETIPLWMTSEQTFGDQSSVLGFTAVIPIFFFKPGEGLEIYADLLDDEAIGNRTKGQRLRFTALNFEASVDDNLQAFPIHFHSLLETQEAQATKAELGPIWNTLPGSLGEFQDGDEVSVSLSATEPNSGALAYNFISGELPTGLRLLSNGLISGEIATTEKKSWVFSASVSGSSGGRRTRTFSIATNF